MAPRARQLEMLGPLTTHFRRRSGKVSHYREFLFLNDGKLAVAGYNDLRVTRPLMVNGKVVFDKSFKAFRVQQKGSTFTTIAIYSIDNRFLGVYSDATSPWQGIAPAHGREFETHIDDLFLDHFIFPDGRSFVLDLGELHEGLAQGSISSSEAQMAFETVTWIDSAHRSGAYPTPEFRGLRLDPDLLTSLPKSQE